MNTTASENATRPHEIPAPDRRYGIIAFSHLRWDFVWQRPQQFLSRFAAQHPVLFVEEPEFSLEPGAHPQTQLSQAAENITVARFLLPKDWTRDERFEAVAERLTEEAIESVNAEGAFDRPLLWFYNPMDTPWAVQAFNRRGVVYDCMDELSQFKFAPQNLLDNERMLLGEADVVFTGGYELWTRKSRQHENVHFFGCGVEYNHFAKAQLPETEIPADVKDIPHPILGWFGVIDERMDYPLLAHIANARPDWHLVMVGPVVKVDPASLPQAPNIHWVGQRDYSVLPSYCKAFDICMMSFAINEATEFINPTKALEYLATGRPVISTPVRDVVRQYTEFVDIAQTPEEFVSLAEKALATKDQARIERGIERAKQCSWESTVAQMQELIDKAIETNEEPVGATARTVNTF